MSETFYSNDYLDLAHRESMYNECAVRRSQLCACFYCVKIFDPSQIVDWVDEGSDTERTAACPECEIDSILDGRFPITNPNFLNQMYERFFKG